MRNLESFDSSVIVTSSLYYKRREFEELVQLFSTLNVVDFRLKNYIDIVQKLLSAGMFDRLPDEPEKRKKKLIRLISTEIDAIPDAKTRDRIKDWFNKASQEERDIELGEELLYRYCWAEFIDRIEQEDKSNIPFRDKLSVRPVIPDIGKKEIKSLAEVEIPDEDDDENSQVYETGIKSLDEYVKMRKTNFVVIAARTTVGKSLFMINQAVYNAAKGIKILYVSLEENDVELKKRVLMHVRDSNDNDYVNRVLKNFIIYTPGTSSPTTILDESARIMKEHDINIIFLDYIQLMRYPGMTDWDSLRSLTRELKLFAIKNNVLLVSASQLKREVEYTGANIASMYGSSTIENDANIILLLSQLNGHVKRVNNMLMVKLDIAKNRAGQQAVIDNLTIDYSCGHIIET